MEGWTQGRRTTGYTTNKRGSSPRKPRIQSTEKKWKAFVCADCEKGLWKGGTETFCSDDGGPKEHDARSAKILRP